MMVHKLLISGGAGVKPAGTHISVRCRQDVTCSNTWEKYVGCRPV